MSTAPLPSTVCFLSDLASKDVGDKVKFLGCVNSYDMTTGTLRLQHEYPQVSQDCALVDMNLLLNRLHSSHVQVGEWLNIIGYITSISHQPEAKGNRVYIQAIVHWPAGPLDIKAYEQGLAKTIANDALDKERRNSKK